MGFVKHVAAWLTLLATVTTSVTETFAGPALVLDASDGRIVYAEDMDDEWHPASLTKIMTAYLVFEALKQGKLTLEQKIPYSAYASEQPPSKLGLIVGAEIRVDSALKALIIKSANDIAVTLAEAVSGSEPAFVALMNNTAQRLGMTRTNFVNANGLPAAPQVTTARDLARLARAVIKDFPEYSSYWSMMDARIGKSYIRTHNGLLASYEGANGLKTGFICDSGFNVVATAKRNDLHLIAVVLGSETGADRTLRASILLEHGFQGFEWKQLFSNQTIDTAPIEADARTITSMRKQVISLECGTGRRAIARAKKKRLKKQATMVETKAQPASAQAAATVDQKPASDQAPAPHPQSLPNRSRSRPQHLRPPPPHLTPDWHDRKDPAR